MKTINLKDGEIITLENGDKVKVTLELIEQKVTELIPLHFYQLKVNEKFCFAYNIGKSHYISNMDIKDLSFQYVGKATIPAGDRYIFFNKNNISFAMWSIDNLDFVIKEIK